MQNVDKTKELAAQRIPKFIQDGVVVGLGSGITTTHFLKLLGERVNEALKVRGMASSKASEEIAASLSISVTDFHACPEIDFAIDGAEEATHQLELIKDEEPVLKHGLD